MGCYNCRMCGAPLPVTVEPIVECEYCGSRQPVPSADSEKKQTLFARANRLRLACEFDRAAAVYESIAAEFPEEAEASWGIVLCRYGIEYVDDPATGKKVPTCHRSSFASVLEDADYQQTLDNADPLTRKLYHREAAHIEELREGILSVSASEKPYDIFICYKETDERGGRTLDSVLAQDLYDLLTGKGYRVFFSRISLEDKLGREYEPYIFAALNSAKVMLAVGTCFEHYDAVWVKNEWSRFLKLMEQDREKYLIPCFKDLDAYDMPKEFQRLQAQDLGKVGAHQDLVRGVEKLIEPKAIVEPVSAQTAPQQIVIQQGAANSVDALVKRGYMALEDGEWKKADDFFEQALNQDAELAKAYLGKSLAYEKCKTTDALIRKRRDIHQNSRGQTVWMNPNIAHVDTIVQKYAIKGYVEEANLRSLYDFDLSYHSDVAERKQQYQDEVIFWRDHKLLSRAVYFATGAVAKELTDAKQALFAVLSDRVKQSEEADTAARNDVQMRYEAYLRQADAQAERMYQNGFSRRDNLYRELMKIANASTEAAQLIKIANMFDQLENYQDSRRLAEYCRERAFEEQRKIETEKERQKALESQRELEQKQRRKKVTAAIAAAACVVIAFIFIWSTVITPMNNYNNAVALMDEGNYVDAAEIFASLVEYRDSADQLYACAVALEENGAPYLAATTYGRLGDYRDSYERSLEMWRQHGQVVSIAAGYRHTVGLKANGTVTTVGGDGYDQFDVSDWKSIVAISASNTHTIGLKTDGTVVASGNNDHGQCDVSQWTNIIAVGSGDYYTVGLRADGSVIAAGLNKSGQCDVTQWNNIVAVAVGATHTIGLKADGTVVATGKDENDRCNVSHWDNIVAIGAGGLHTIGLKSDGTVVATGWNEYGQLNVSHWTDIVSICAGNYHTVGLKADGTVVAEGSNRYGQTDVSNWTDIVAISANEHFTIGLKADGTVVAVGGNKYGQCNVSDWTDIMIP